MSRRIQTVAASTKNTKPSPRISACLLASAAGAALMSGSLAMGAISYTDPSVTTGWNASRWNNTADSTPYTSAYTANNNVQFTNTAGYTFNTGIGAGTINIGDVTVDNNVNVSFTGTVAGTYATNAVVRTFTIGNGATLDFSSQSFTTSATTGFIKNGSGVLALAGNTYGGGFTLNSGTVIARGVNAMGAASTLTINGGTIAANLTRDFTGKYTGGITVGGNFTLGATTGLALNTANLTFSNNVALGGATRTITIGGDGKYLFGGIVSNGGITVASTATGQLAFSGANTYSSDFSLNSGTALVGVGSVNSGTSITSGALGVGTVNLAGGTILASNGGTSFQMTHPRINVSGNMQIGATVTNNGRLQVAGTWDFGGGARTITLGKASTSLASGLEVVGFTTPTGFTAPTFQNGSLVLTTTTGSVATPSVARFSQANFASNLALTLDDGVAATSQNGNFFFTGSNAPALTLVAPATRGGGVLHLGDGNAVMRSAEVFSLSGGGTITSANTTTTGQTGTLTINNGNGATFSGLITEPSGTGVIALTKSGAGTQTLSGSNTYTGVTTISAGTLKIGSTTALGSGTSTLARRVGTANSIAGNGTSSVSTNAVLDLNGQSISGEALTLSGTGSGSTGALINSSATPVTIDGAGKAFASLAIATNGTGTTASATPSFSVTGVGLSGFAATAQVGVTSLLISAGGSGYVNGSAFTGPNGLTGSISVTSGAITGFTIINPGSGFTSLPTIGSLTISGGGTGATINASTSTLGLTGVNVSNWGSGLNTSPTISISTGLTTEGTVTLAPMAVTLAADSSIGGTGNISVAMPIVGTKNLTKVGGNKLTLSATNTYSGTTTLTSGTLLVNGSITSPVFDSGGILGGTGVINGAVSLTSSSATLSPGASIESLDIVGNTDLGAGTLLVEFDASASPAIDLLNVTGDLNISLATVNFSQIGTALNPALNYVFANYSTLTGSQFASVTNLPSTHLIDYSYNGGTSIALVVIPEPSTTFIGAMLGGIALLSRRRRR